MKKFYSIDPGLAGTGWAEWLDRRTPSRVGVIYPKGETPDIWVAKAEDITSRLLVDSRIPNTRDVEVYIEMPQQMSNARGIAAQAGAVYKLAFLVGYIARAVHPATVHAVTPSEWKGQLPKDVVQRRIIQYLGNRECVRLNIRSHAWDAVGLGLWASGIWRD